MANLTSEVAIGRLSLENYAQQVGAENARICRDPLRLPVLRLMVRSDDGLA